MKRKWLWTGAGAAALGLALFFPMAAQAAAVPDGIYVDGQNLGGLEAEEAGEQIAAYVEKMAGQTVTLEVAGNQVSTTAAELGFHWENTDAVEETMEEYVTGNVVSRYLKQKELEQNPVDVKLDLQIDGGAVASFVETQCAPYIKEAVDASIVRENGGFTVTPSQDGMSVDLEATTARLNEALSAGLEHPVVVEAAVTETKPARTTEALSTIQDVLGTFSTDFSSSSSARVTNLQVGSAKINGRVLMPGETLSGYECMQPFTRENGYAAAGAYENGQLVDSIGGGVCQIATTLYNAALLAEMEITQRQNHSMTVSYVPPSNDAAIAGTYKDIKITNPYDTPVYVEAGTSGRTLTFTIYGKETRPANRTIKYVSETLSVTNPGDPITQVDASLQPGARVRVQSPHNGVRSRLWKYVYIDGVETEKTILHTDTYNASKAIYRVGPELPAAAPAETQPAAETQPVQETVPAPVLGVDGGPGVSAPAPTEAAGPGGLPEAAGPAA